MIPPRRMTGIPIERFTPDVKTVKSSNTNVLNATPVAIDHARPHLVINRGSRDRDQKTQANATPDAVRA